MYKAELEEWMLYRAVAWPLAQLIAKCQIHQPAIVGYNEKFKKCIFLDPINSFLLLVRRDMYDVQERDVTFCVHSIHLHA
jgi:hypothetical protein